MKERPIRQDKWVRVNGRGTGNLLSWKLVFRTIEFKYISIDEDLGKVTVIFLAIDARCDSAEKKILT